MRLLITRAAAVLALLLLAGPAGLAQAPQDDTQKFRFRTGVELINVNATVTDHTGRFVSGLRKEDFRVYQDEELQPITHFNAERVPVSLGILLDTSSSMDGDKIVAAKRAIERFLDLLGREDEVFLYTFDSRPELVQGWTNDMTQVREALRWIQPDGGTAIYDTVAEAIPLAQSGRHRKKAMVIISDGNDTSSQMELVALKALIRESEVLVYAVGIDASADTFPPVRSRLGGVFSQIGSLAQTRPRPLPFPVPGRPRPRPGPTPAPPPRGPYPPTYPPATPPVSPPTKPRPNSGSTSASRDRVNIAALRDITDDSGGRTEIVRSAYDLGPATANIADELSKQYYLGYPATGVRDGRWHAIRVEVRGNYIVRARRGFMATP